MKSKTCGECKYFNKKTWGCEMSKQIERPHNAACGAFRGETETVFERLTASPEALAPTLIRLIVCEKNPNIKGWTSNVVQSVFKTYVEAYDATVARLNEVDNGN